MPLPNPNMTFTPFDPLPASDLNDMVENIEALADGSGFDVGAIGANPSALESGATGLGFIEIKRTTLAVAGDVITVDNIPLRKYLFIVFTVIADGNIATVMRFNNDSANNYAFQYILNNTGSNTVSAPNIGNLTSGAFSGYGDMRIVNIPTLQKLFNSITTYSSATAGTAPNHIVMDGLWNNTVNGITRVDLANTGPGNFAIGSQVIVLGRN